MKTRDHDEVSDVEYAERRLREEKRRSDQLIAAGPHDEATLVNLPDYYWKWVGQFGKRQRATRRLSIVVPLVLATMFVLICIVLGRSRMALIVFSGTIVSALGGCLILYFWGANL